MKTLYAVMKGCQNDYDVYDAVFDTCVTVCPFDSEDELDTDPYEKFRIGILRFVPYCDYLDDFSLVANWTAMIKANMPIFQEFMKKNWRGQVRDEDTFIYEWIRELHYWSAGYTTDDVYKDFVENYMSRMEVPANV